MIGFHVPPTGEKNQQATKNTSTSRTIVVADKGSQLFLPTQRGVTRIRYNINDRNSVQPNHLLKIDESPFIPINIIHGKTEVRSVRVGFEDISPVGIGRLGDGDMQEDRVGARLQDRVSL